MDSHELRPRGEAYVHHAPLPEEDRREHRTLTHPRGLPIGRYPGADLANHTGEPFRRLSQAVEVMF